MELLKLYSCPSVRECELFIGKIFGSLLKTTFFFQLGETQLKGLLERVNGTNTKDNDREGSCIFWYILHSNSWNRISLANQHAFLLVTSGKHAGDTFVYLYSWRLVDQF